VHGTSTNSSVNRELEVLKAKRGEPAAAVDVEHLDEVEALKAKLAGNAAAKDETRSLDLLRTKSVDRGAPTTDTPADDELETLKAKRGKPGALDVERPDEVQALKVKLAGNLAATEGETARRAVRKTKLERSSPADTLPRGAFAVASTVGSASVAASDGAALRRRSAFDLAFALVVALWALAVALALTTGAAWWFFGFCVVVTVAVALFGLLDLSGKPRQN
jgi:hypothetical protein